MSNKQKLILTEEEILLIEARRKNPPLDPVDTMLHLSHVLFFLSIQTDSLDINVYPIMNEIRINHYIASDGQSIHR